MFDQHTLVFAVIGSNAQYTILAISLLIVFVIIFYIMARRRRR